LGNLTLWSADAMNARGQYAQETFGNGVIANHTFDPMTGLPQSITAGVSGGAALQDNAYLFDGVGNLKQRQDMIAGTTENVYPDSLNRLDHTVGDTNTTMTYDALGRIATWEAYGASANVIDYTTPQSGCTYYANVQPHAARKKTQGSWPPESSCYDANGNKIAESSSGSVDRGVTWTSFNQPSAITAPGYNSSSQFLYDENHQRFEQIASYSGSPENTEYIGGLMEKMTNSTGTSYRYYVPADNNFIVYNRWTNGTNAIDYVTTDQIGSTAVITDANGSRMDREWWRRHSQPLDGARRDWRPARV
jgi:YD repeat-containing protein